MTAPIVKRTPSKGESMLLEILAGLQRKGRVLKFRFENEGIYIVPNRKVFPVADRVVLVKAAFTSQHRKELRGKRVCAFNPGTINNAAYARFKAVLNYFISQPVPLYSKEVAAQLGTFLTLLSTLNMWKMNKRIQAVSYTGGWKVKVKVQGNKYPVPIPTSVRSMDAYLTGLLGPANNSAHSPAEVLVHKALKEMEKEKLISSFLIHPRNTIVDASGIDITIIPNRKHFPKSEYEVQLQIKRTSESKNIKYFLQKHAGQKIAIIKIGKNMQINQVKMMLRFILERPVQKIDGEHTGLEEFIKEFAKQRIIAAKKNKVVDYAGEGKWILLEAKAKV